MLGKINLGIRDSTPYHRRRTAEDALKKRWYSTRDLASLLRVSNRTGKRIIDELSLFLPVQQSADNRYRIL